MTRGLPDGRPPMCLLTTLFHAPPRLRWAAGHRRYARIDK
jgi:hypothetical protein